MSMSNVNRRNQRRIAKRHNIYFGTKEPNTLGFVKNLSLDGVAIQAKSVYPPATYLKLMIPTPEAQIRLEGEVRWSSAQHLARQRLFLDMGILYQRKDEAYLGFLEKIIEEFRNRRIEPRFNKVYRVAFETPKELLDEYSQNISMGGMYISTQKPPGVNSMVEINIVIPEIMKVIHAEARVVHVVDENLATRIGMEPGIGTQFVRFFEQDKEVFYEYINELKRLAGLVPTM